MFNIHIIRFYIIIIPIESLHLIRLSLPPTAHPIRRQAASTEHGSPCSSDD